MMKGIGQKVVGQGSSVNAGGAVNEVEAKPEVVTSTTPDTSKTSATSFTGGQTTAKQQLTDAATRAATEAAVQGHEFNSPLLEKFGESVGLALGVIVTEALAFSKKWNAPLIDGQGQDVKAIEGATRIGEHDLRVRHQQVVGPKVEAYVETLKPGVIHEVLEGLARGASNAPGVSYRIEAKVSDWLHGTSE